MTGMTAEQYHLGDRGASQERLPADLVLFDPAQVQDRSTIEKPHEISAGIRSVWVNGELVWDGAKATGARPGEVVRRANEALTRRERCGPSHGADHAARVSWASPLLAGTAAPRLRATTRTWAGGRASARFRRRRRAR